MSIKKLLLTPFKIRLLNPEHESKFKAKNMKNSRRKLLISLIINTILVIALVVIFPFIEDKTFEKIGFLAIILCIQICLLVATLCLFLIYSSKEDIQGLCSLLNYLLLSLFFINGRRILRYAFEIDALIYDWMFYIDILIKVVWVSFELSDYTYILIGNGISFVVGKSLAIYYERWPTQLVWNLLVSDLFLVLISAMSFLIMKRARFLFYFINELKDQKTWYLDIVNNMNSGFIKVTNEQIVFVNQTITDIFVKLSLIDSDSESQTISAIKKSSYSIFRSLFKDVQFANYQKTTNISTEEDLTLLTSSNNETDARLSQIIFDKIKLEIKNCKTKEDKFIYVGRGKIMTEDNNVFVYEYYSRYYKREEGDNFEIILNNVTRTKLLEEKNAEIRLKSLVLSKIAHEFKNPLMCMSEIIDEEVSNNDSKRKMSFMLIIKSISNYLLVLVKNIDFFSEMQSSSNNKKLNQLNPSKCSLNEILEFIQMITTYLLKKNKSEMAIKFNIINRNHIDIIEADEIKIKQLLINLISNSLKFTTKGSITLTVSQGEDNHIVFSIKDTGIGIPESLKNYLFNAFSSAKRLTDNNKYGTGLGLAISKELSLLLGKGIFFNSKEGEGSEFWFSVYIGDNSKSVNTSLDSIATIKKITLIHQSPLLSRSIGGLRHVYLPIKNISKTYNIILADDEVLIRQSTIKLLNKYAEQNKFNINIKEASDGIELVCLYFKKSIENEVVDIIITDQNMTFYSGHKAAREIKEMSDKLGLIYPKVYLSSAYCQDNDSCPLYIDGIFNKPLLNDDLNKMFSFDV